MSNFVLTAQLTLQAPNNTRRVLNQIQSQLQNVNVAVNLNANPSQFRNVNNQINSVNQNAQAASASVSELGRTIGAAARRFGAISLATGTFLSLTRSIKGSIGDAIEFERQMTVLAQTTEKSVKELKGLYNEVTRLATGLGVSSDGLIKTSIILAQAGLDARKTKAALEVLAKTQLAASFDDIGSTTEGAIAILAQFRKEAASAGGDIKFLEQSLESINQVSKKYAVESSDLIAVIRRSGGAFEAAGGSLNELLALFTSVRATTRESAETISTGLRTIFTRIQRVDTIKQLKELGIVLQDTEGKFVGPFEAVKRISEGLSSLDPRDFRFAQIVEELGGFRQIGKVIPLIKQFSLAQEALNTAQESSGSLARDAETAQTALANKISKVKEEFQALVREFTDSESFRSVANGALEFAQALIRIADAIQPLIPLIASLAAVNIGRGLASALGSFSGFSRRNTGGRILGFATGGMVPGSGNGDTVPAMLSPGEFVIRKASVKKIGIDNLQKLNKGGIVGRNRLADTKEVSALILAPESKIPNKELDFSISKKEFPYQNEFDARAIGKYKFYRTGIAETQDVKSKIDYGIVEGLKSAINIASSGVASALGLKNPEFDKSLNFSKMVNPGAKGTIFEEMISHLARSNEGEPFDKKTDPNSPFDFIGSIGKVASLFGSQKAANVKYKDAKNSVKESGQSGFESKTLRQLIAESLSSATSKRQASAKSRSFIKDIKGSFFPSKKALEEYIVKSGVASASSVSGSKLDDWLIENNLSPDIVPHESGSGKSYRFAKGGVAPSDTVPALLTPGEFVVNRASAKRIGYGELNRMNKTGEVRGYAQGGTVQNQYSAFAPYVGGASGSSTSASSVQTSTVQASASPRDILRSAQSFVFLSGSASALGSQFTDLSDTSKQAVTETLAFAMTMTGIVGTMGDFAFSLVDMVRNTASCSGGLLAFATSMGGIPLVIAAALAPFALLIVASKNLSKAISEESKKRADSIAADIEQGKRGLESRQKYIDEEVKSAKALTESYYVSFLAIQDEISARRSSAEAYIDLVLATQELDEKFRSFDADKSLSILDKSSKKISAQLESFSKTVESAQKASSNSSKIRAENNLIGKNSQEVSRALSGYSIGQSFEQAQNTIKNASENFNSGFSSVLLELQSSLEESIKKTTFSTGKDPFKEIVSQNSLFAKDLESSRKKINESAFAMAKIMLENGETQEQAVQFLTKINKSFSSFENSAKKQAVAAEASARSSVLLNEAVRNSAKGAFVIAELSSSLSKVSSSVKVFGSSLSNIQSTLNAEISSFSLDKIEGLDSLGNIVDFDKFQSDVGKLSSSFGEFGDSIAKEIIGVAGVFKNSKSLLGREFIGIGDDAGGEAKDSIEQALLPLKGLGGAFESLRNRATAELTKAAAPGSDSGAVISAAELENALSPLKDFSEKNIQLLKSLNDTQASLVDQYSSHSKVLADIFQSEASLREKAVKVELTGAQRMSQATGNPLTLQQKESFRLRASQERLTVAGVNAKAGDVSGLAASLSETEKAIQANKENRKSIKDNVIAVKNSISEERSLVIKLRETKSALEGLADQSEKAADIMSEIEKERGKREFGMKTLEGLVSGSVQDRFDTMKSFSGLAAASATGTLQGLDPETRKATFSLLDQLSSVDDRFKQLKKNLVISDAVRMGIDPRTAMSLASATPIEQKLQQDLITVTNQELEAVKALTASNNLLKDELVKNTTGVSISIEKLPEKISETLNSAFAKFVAEEDARKQKSDSSRVEDAKRAADLKAAQISQEDALKKEEALAKGSFKKDVETMAISIENANKLVQGQGQNKKATRGNIIPEDLYIGAKYARGGPVYAQSGAYMKPKGTDTVPAMLTPGEFVVKKSSVDKYGVGMMQSINSGKYLASGGSTIKVSRPDSEEDIATRKRLAAVAASLMQESKSSSTMANTATRKAEEEKRPANEKAVSEIRTAMEFGTALPQEKQRQEMRKAEEASFASGVSDFEKFKASRAKDSAAFEAGQSAPRDYITKYTAKNKSLVPAWAKDSASVDMRSEAERYKSSMKGGKISGLSSFSQDAMAMGRLEMLVPPSRKGLIGGMKPESYANMETFNKTQESFVGPQAPGQFKTYTPEQRDARLKRQDQVKERLKTIQNQQRGAYSPSYQDPINSILGGMAPQQNALNRGAGNVYNPVSPTGATQQASGIEAVMSGFKDFSAKMSEIADRFSGLTVEHKLTVDGQISMNSAEVAEAVRAAVSEYVSGEINKILGKKEKGLTPPI